MSQSKYKVTSWTRVTVLEPHHILKMEKLPKLLVLHQVVLQFLQKKSSNIEFRILMIRQVQIIITMLKSSSMKTRETLHSL